MSTQAPASDPLIRIAAVSVIVALAVSGLSYGAAILVPVVEAIIVWFVLNSVARSLRRVPRVGAYMGGTGSKVIAVLFFVALGFLAVFSGVRSTLDLGPQAAELQTSLDPLLVWMSEKLGTDRSEIVNRALDAIGIESLVQRLVLGVIGLINQFGIVAIYVAFLFADQQFFGAKMRVLFPDPRRRAEVSELLSDMGRQIGAYLWLMTRVSAMTAGLSYVIMVALGLETPVFWAILVFLLNFIPTIGSILGALLPTVIALVQFPDIFSVLLLCAGLSVVQFTIGNVVFPRIAGNTLNLSFFVTILSLIVWGTLWGITGMFLAVPMTAVLVMVMARFPATRTVAILLSQSGQVDRHEISGRESG